MGLREEIQKYRQPDGLIVPKLTHDGPVSQDETGNGLKYFSLYHALLVRRGESTFSDYIEFCNVLLKCRADAQGNYFKSPTKTSDQITKDDLCAIAYASKLLKTRHAYDILNYGNSKKLGPLKWFYPNLFPELFEDQANVIPLKYLVQRTFWESWIGKNPEVITHLQNCGLPFNHRPHILRFIYQAIYFLVVKMSHSGLCTNNYMMVNSVNSGENSFLDLAVAIWEERLEKQWPGGMLEVLTDELESKHPIVRFWI